ncbi:molybdopterin binding oxidoreductase [Meira miltonrushii]|uniref:Molybdopterin binding oxidoreductase n=1 Tax=Meira miltonrushii TaxID=1280837 RepID=A0A316V9M4_9BASI|nr:molybdopterin binding oxidoreductase [Meira miltonrushii]PWN32903.1 molybdopterin binding oxidoreductase [Meira miltonrushii]
MSNIDNDALTIHQKDRHGIPLNAEVNKDELIRDFITPTEKIFHRNHDDIVQIPKASLNAVEEEWRVSITLDDEVAKQERIGSWVKSLPSILIPYGDLLHAKGKCKDVKRIRTTATLECAGNRREDLSDQEKTEGIQWSSGAISTAHWYGISIRDLLIQVGIEDPYKHHKDLFSLQPSESDIAKDCATWATGLHIHMLSAQPTSESDQPTGEYFGASIPLSVAMHPQQQCILATHQNDQILTQSHGFPLRAVIPGHVGARWVKWLRGLRISTKPEDSPPMRLDYKLLKPPKDASEEEKNAWKAKISGEEKDEDFRKAELSKEEPMQTLGVGSAIEEPKSDSNVSLDSGKITVRGYAVGQDGSQIAKVEVTVLAQNEEQERLSSLRDRAESGRKDQWIQATLQTDTSASRSNENVSWAWSLWEAQLPVPSANKDNGSACFAIVARATTTSGVEQEKESDWNVRGFNTRSWPVIRGLRIDESQK